MTGGSERTRTPSVTGGVENMTTDTLDDIRARLRAEEYKSSEQVILSVAARLLQALGWDIWNPAETRAGFQGRPGEFPSAAFALCLEPDVPAVYVDVCATGTIKDETDRLERALRDRHRAAPAQIAVITDGEVWKLYAPEGDDIAESCFRTIDIVDDDPREQETAFTAFLSKAEIAAGNARGAARSIIFQKTAAQTILEVLPEARRLVTEPPYPRLPEAVAKLASERGVPVTEEEAIAVLSRAEIKKPTPADPPAPPKKKEAPAPPPKEVPVREVEIPDFSRKNIRSFRFRGIVYTPNTWKEFLVKFCEIVHDDKGDEFQKCLAIGFNNKSVFSKNIKDLFGNSPVQIGKTDYYVMTNFTANHIVQLVYRILDIFGYPREEFEITAE